MIPYGRQTIDEDDIAAVAAAMRGDFLTTGPLVAKFETALCDVTGVRHGAVCTSGTAALHLAAMALDLGPGQAAVVPTLTFLATANAVRMTGAEVVFADVDPETGLMTPETLREALTRAPSELRATAAFPVHLNGQTVNMAGIAEIAADAGLSLVEDACHALGTVDAAGERVGNCRHSAMACFSFHPVKTVTTAEGGAVTTQDAALAERVKLLRNHGMVRDPAALQLKDLAFDASGKANPWYYEMPEFGFNYRLPDLNCALGLSQLAKLQRFAAARQKLVAAYDRAFADASPRLRLVARRGGQPVWHLYVVLIDFDEAGKTSRAEVMAELQRRGIGTQVHYLPVHLQPYYRKRYGAVNLPGAWHYYQRCLSLPLFPGMVEADCERVAAALIDILQA